MSGLDLPDHVHPLLDAVVAIGSDLDLHSVLERITYAACQLTGARYGALGVIDASGDGLVDFVTHGVTQAQRDAIGELPRGHGILGLLIDHPQALRLTHLQEHPESYGFPAHHPPMESFLGVPVRIRGRVFGNLYLTEKAAGADFDEADEKLVEALATAAGFVIENAQTFARSERRRQWLEATARVTEALQPPVQLEDALRQIVIGARRVGGADAVALLAQHEGERSVAAVDGPAASTVGDLLARLEEDIARTQDAGQPVVVHAGSRRGVGTTVLVPLRSQIADAGMLVVALGSRAALEPEELELLAGFADQASLALDRAQALADREELLLVADRDRIARDLHDLVIQRLFATGLQLQGARRIAVSEDVARRLDAAVTDLDVTIRDIRSTIFELQHAHTTQSLRADVRSIVKEYVPVLGFSPLVRTNGPLDTVVPRGLADQLLAVLREALSNIARHAEAQAAMVEVDATDGRLLLRVVDNGKGLPPERHESGLRNVRRRANEHGGTVQMVPEEPSGTRVEWSVPLPV